MRALCALFNFETYILHKLRFWKVKHRLLIIILLHTLTAFFKQLVFIIFFGKNGIEKFSTEKLLWKNNTEGLLKEKTDLNMWDQKIF